MASRIKTLQTYSRFFTISPSSLKDEGRHSTAKYSVQIFYKIHTDYTTRTNGIT